MYLKTLTLKDFKSHKDTTIEFDQITSIIGKNDCGKTNVIRALKMLLHNEDWPATWIRYGAEAAKITVTLESGLQLIRSRTAKSQSISIKHPSGKVENFSGKKDAQQYVEKALGIRKITLDEGSGPEDLYFIGVHEGPYLLGSRSDTVQRKVVGIMGANEIEDARIRLTKEAKKASTRIEFLADELGSCEKILDVVEPWLNRINELFNNCEDLHDQWSDLQESVDELSDISNQFHSLSSNIPTEKELEELQETIQCLYTDRVKLKTDLQVLESIKYLQQYEPPSIKPLQDHVDELVRSVLKLGSEWMAIKLLENAVIVQEEIEQAEAEQNEAERMLEALKKSKELALKDMGICPMCGRET